jgi:hypothetical protein
MRKKYKLTVFARFIIFMAVFTPVAFMGISYYQGEDGLQKIKDIVNIDRFRGTNEAALPKVSESNIIELKDKEIQLLKEEIKILEQKLELANKLQDSVQ